MRKLKKVCAFYTVIIFLLILLTNRESSISGGLLVGEYTGESFTWIIDNVSIGNNQWLNSSWAFIANWHANTSDEISFTVDSFQTISEGEYLTGVLEIGNLTLETNNYDIGISLTLSFYPWIGGLITLEENWGTLNTRPPFNGGNATINDKIITTALGLEIETIVLTYEDGFQETELVYETITGLLIYANTTASNFNLEMHLTESTIPLPTATNEGTLFSFVGWVISLFGFILIVKKFRS